MPPVSRRRAAAVLGIPLLRVCACALKIDISLVLGGGPWYNRDVLDGMALAVDCPAGSPFGAPPSWGSLQGRRCLNMTIYEALSLTVALSSLTVQILVWVDQRKNHKRH